MTILTIDIEPSKVPFLFDYLNILKADIIEWKTPKLSAKQKERAVELAHALREVELAEKGVIKLRSLDEFLAEFEQENKKVKSKLKAKSKKKK